MFISHGKHFLMALPVAVAATLCLLRHAEAIEPAIEARDTVVTIDRAPVRMGEQTLLTLPPGIKLAVQLVRSDWVLIEGRHENRDVHGWVEAKHVALAATDSERTHAAAQRHDHVLLERTDDWLRKADEAQDAEDLEGTRKAYVEALKTLAMHTALIPDDTDAIEKAGLLRADLEDYGGAYAALKEVLRRDPDRMNTRRKLAEAAMVIGRYSDAREHIETHLLPNAPDNGELLEMLGMCQIRCDENDKAVASFQRAIENSPGRISAYQLLSHVLTDRNRHLAPDLEAERLAQADACMEKMLKSNAGSPRAHLTYIEYLASLTRINSMDDAWKHPLLLEKMGPSLLTESVKHPIKQLDTPSDATDRRQLEEHDEALMKAVKLTIETLLGDLALDDPSTLLPAARVGLRSDDLTDDDFLGARKKALGVLEDQLSADDNGALRTAVKHGLIVDATRHALGLLGNHSRMLWVVKHSVLDDVASHASTARTFLAADRATLEAAEKNGILAAAIEKALAAKDPGALGLASRDRTIAAAVGHATEGIQLPENDADTRPKSERQRVLVEAVRIAFADHQLSVDDRERLLKCAGRGDALTSIIARATNKRDTALEEHDRRAIIILARIALARGESELSRALLETGLELYPDDVSMYSLRADIDQQTGRLKEAIAGLRMGLQATENNAMLLWKMALMLIAAEEIDEAEQVINQLATAQYRPTSELPPADIAESFLRARLEFQQRHWLAVSKRTEQLRSRLAEWPELLKQADVLLGVAYTQLGDTDRQLAAYLRVLEVDPHDRAALTGMADGLTLRGRLDEALKYRRRFAALDGGNTLQLVRTLIQANLRRPPAERDWREIQELLDRIAAADPESAPRAILQSEVFLAQGKAPEAVAILNDAWKRHPKDTAVWSTLATLEQQLENWDRVEELLRVGNETIDDEVVQILVRVQYETRRYVDDVPQRIDAALKAVETLSEADRLRALNGLLSASLRSNADTQARRICHQLSALDPANIRIHFLWFQLTVRAKDEIATREVLARIEKIEGKNGPHWLYGAAVVLSLSAKDGQDKRLAQALELLNEARRQRPDWGQVALLAAGIHDQKGNHELALKNYLRAIELGEGHSKACGRAVQLLRWKGRHTEADQLVDWWRRRETAVSPKGMR